MNKIAQWVIWFLVLVPNSILVYLFVSFSLFGAAAEKSPIFMDYLLATGIVLIANITTVQQIIAIQKKRSQGFIYGVIVAVAQILGLYVFAITFSKIGLAITIFSIFSAILLVVRAVRQPKKTANLTS
ncbi:hypothetical protein DV702_14405 [Sporosarcina sp. PTS2304]|uniref:hypothetical protein n=1 Tax=Sporosarcina sp. PTS2304 TaxID=2283194 RepID=UPI000E0D1F1E|nr:hypothetical protein [Sporosarcina sp. PTS2304]AXI00792.1 hypothetical protein DV702_14405 [Sporosarcina sp. PTS2304]